VTVTFSRIEPSKKDLVAQFRKDAHVISFGNTNEFDEDAYVQFALRGSEKFPEGFVFVTNNNEIIGQMELQIKDKDNNKFGFINLFYLVPEYRGKGFSNHLDQYATSYFKDNGCSYCLLRVEKSNTRAIRFYEKCGFKKLSEDNGLVTYRKNLDPE
jgi:ribosomal protein S18 acetylase RimI-like enzyme